MCCSCSQVYIPNKEAVLANKDNLEECFKHIFVRFAPDVSWDWDITDAKKIQINVEKNFTDFMKQYYLFTLDNPQIGYPFDIAYPNVTIENNSQKDPENLLEHLLLCSFIAHRNLRKVINNYVKQIEMQTEKKRQRRLRHKENLKKKKLNAANGL
jgi:hypothetical protein